MTTQESNKLIAEFLGKDIGHEKMVIWDKGWTLMKFHSSWDWLMPVVEKIESLGYRTSFKTRYCRINPNNGMYWEYVVTVDVFGVAYQYLDNDEQICLNENFYMTEAEQEITKLQMVYLCVVEFIKWYNKNK